ncbi:MAG: ferrous iron transport protein B [Ignavibacteriae bacterium]|nr:ferrous iron transport protein B [Ignavibacteriota bacterium]
MSFETATTATSYIALIGNPNSGKTTLFNALTGLRQRVGNYPGVTVEKKEGRLTLPDGSEAILLDLPGTYSLNASSPDERIATDVLLGKVDHTQAPELVICVVDASNIERNLYLVSQIIDRRIPVIIALNMVDVAEHAGIEIDAKKLARSLSVPVVPLIASRSIGVDQLKRAIKEAKAITAKTRSWRMPPIVEEETEELIGYLQRYHKLNEANAFHEALSLLSAPESLDDHRDRYAPEVIAHVRKDHERLNFMGIDRQSVFVESRYEWIKNVCTEAVKQTHNGKTSVSDRIDRIATHKIWGFVVFLALMAIMFQSVFTWAEAPMSWIEDLTMLIGDQIKIVMPAGDLRDLIIDGGLAGVSAVVVFLPQILLLFMFIGLLEDTGYMARAAFIMDRLMSKVGLHGKSFIPMLSSFACAIPGIMATRTIESPKDRLVTMLVSPLISCSARLPVYTLLIAAFIPTTYVLGFLSLAGLTLLSMYLLGLVMALTMAWFFKKTLLKGPAPLFIMELPPYKTPSVRSISLQMWERSKLFLRNAGTIILGVSILLWFLGTYPKSEGTPAQQLEHSFIGRAGQAIGPLIKPLGFDWKIGIAVCASFAAREVFVSTMGTIYNIQESDEELAGSSLQEKMRNDKDPVTGAPVWSALTAICVMVYYVLAMQCISTIAVMRRETNGWKWPLFQIGYMTALAYGATFIVYRVGLALGLGA